MFGYEDNKYRSIKRKASLCNYTNAEMASMLEWQEIVRQRKNNINELEFKIKRWEK